MNLSFRQS